jgi:hypothetical protein
VVRIYTPQLHTHRLKCGVMTALYFLFPQPTGQGWKILRVFQLNHR